MRPKVALNVKIFDVKSRVEAAFGFAYRVGCLKMGYIELEKLKLNQERGCRDSKATLVRKNCRLKEYM